MVLDRGYVDFARLYALVQRQCSFVVRGKDNLSYKTIDSHAFDCSTGVRCDQTIQLLTKKSEKAYPEPLRRVAFFDEKTQLDLVFLSNRMDLPALTIAAIYKQRWQIELFFKWLKQNLTVKHFFGNSLNAVKSQIWIAVCVYLIALIAHKDVGIDISLRNFLHLVEVNMFEKITLQQMVSTALQGEALSELQAQQEMF